MRRRILIDDGSPKGRGRLALTYLDAVEQWMPDQPGFVRAGKTFDDNPANMIVESAYGWMDLFLFTESGQGDGKVVVVMKLRQIRRVNSERFDNTTGFGELSLFGAAKLRWGTLKWWLL
jgi:hypothetical protein